MPEFERFADESDRASWLEQCETEEALAEQRRRAAPEQVRDENGNWETNECVDCGDEIPHGRLTLGKVRCVDCQRLLERRGKQRGHF